MLDPLVNTREKGKHLVATKSRGMATALAQDSIALLNAC